MEKFLCDRRRLVPPLQSCAHLFLPARPAVDGLFVDRFYSLLELITRADCGAHYPFRAHFHASQSPNLVIRN